MNYQYRELKDGVVIRPDDDLIHMSGDELVMEYDKVDRLFDTLAEIKKTPKYGEWKGCICKHFSDTNGFRIADLACPVHGVNGTNPGDGFWDEN